MKKFLLKTVLFLSIFMISFSVAAWGDETNPIDGSASGGYDGKGGVACGGNCSYSFDPTSKGVRLSLYRYPGGGKQHLKAVGKTVDMIVFGQTWSSSVLSTDRKGKLTYTMIENSKPVFKRSAGGLKLPRFFGIKSLYIPDYWDYPGFSVDEPSFRASVIEYFKLRGTVREIATVVNNFFGIAGTAQEINPAIEVLPYYIAIEPTIRHTVAGTSYYGTAYELNMELFNKNNSSVSQWMNTHYGNALVSQLNQEESDIYNLVAPRKGKESVDYFIDSVTGSSQQSGLSINTNPRSAYGISVYFLSAFRATCQTACGGKMGDDKLSCAEQWCENTNGKNDVQNKAYCMTECGINPDDYKPKCPPVLGNKKAPVEVCTGTSKNVIPSCVVQKASLKEGGDYYYLEKCTVESDVTFPEITGLIKPGEGFEFPTLVAGNKSCTLEFSADYWKWLYASLSNSNKAPAFNAIKDFEAKDWKTQKYNSSLLNMTLQVEYDVSGKKTAKEVKLLPDRILKDSDLHVTKTVLPAKQLYSFIGGKRFNASVRDAKSENNNQTMYRLSQVCISRTVNGKVYDATAGKCISDDFGPYNKFYTDFKTKIGSIISTAVKVTDNNPGGLPNDYLCSSPPRASDVACSLVTTGMTKVQVPRETYDKHYYDGDIIKYKLQVEGDRTKAVNAGVTGGTLISAKDAIPLEFSVPVKFTEKDSGGYATQRIEGWIQRTDGTRVLCPVIIKTKETPSCPACVCQLTKETVNGVTTYRFLRQNENPAGSIYYIRAGGPFDVNNPASGQYIRDRLEVKDGELPQSVYASVVINGRIYNKDCEYLVTPKTCSEAINECSAKSTMTCVVAFCSNDSYRMSAPGNYLNRDDCIERCSGTALSCKQKYLPTQSTLIKQYCSNNYRSDGYPSAEICISDCSALGADYFYRSVNPVDPFPQRSAIGNWYGLEDLIKNDAEDKTSISTGKPEYVINLNSTAIREIRNSNATLNRRGESAYTDYYMASRATRPKGVPAMEYRSKFINDKSNNDGFNQYFKVINGINK